MFKMITENIYKLDIPFENITTSSFLVRTPEGDILVDCGTYESDVTDILLPVVALDDAVGLIVFAVSFGSFKYPAIKVGPEMQISPSSPVGASSNVSGIIIL